MCLIYLLIPALYKSFDYLLTYLIFSLLIYLLPYLFTSLTVGPSISRPEAVKGDQTWLSFVCLFCVVVYYVNDVFAFVVLDLAFQY